jgi:TfoX/Sxy family transcriptional regulator of competence genes
MAVDEGLAALLREDLGALDGVVETRMFGGLVFLRRGNMVCGTYRDRGMFRVGKERAAEALALPGTEGMTMGGRAMPGMVEARSEAVADDAVRRQLLALALAVTEALPAK